VCLVGARKRVKIGPELDWLSDDNRAGLSDGKDECTPAIRNRAAAATQSECACRHSSSDWQKRWGHGEAGMESGEGTAFESLPRRKRCRNTPDQPFLLLMLESAVFMPRWCFRWVLLRAKEETLRLAKLDRS
jgi:hypothetical protein